MKYLNFTLAMLLGTISYAQDFYDLQTIQTIEVTFAQSDWDQLLDTEYATTGDYIMAQSVAINGMVFDSVGVKYKGNSTYNANQTKNPFHIELDTYKDHQYEAYTDIKLSNVAKDPSFVREVLSYQVLRQYMDAPLSNYANVYVNGALMGLYSNSESVSKKFVNSRFYSKKNTFVKCNPPAGAGPGTTDYPNLVYLGADSTAYYDAYEIKSDYGWDELIDLCDTLANYSSTEIEKILDVDRALWMIAFDNILVNLDSYIGGFAQNYYLYRDDYGRFLPVVWDLNESFGTFSNTGSGNLNNTTSKQQMSHLLHENDADYPLIQNLLAIPMYKRMYLAHCKTILLENFDNSTYFTTGQTLQTLIDASVQADGNKFFTYNNFTSNLTSDVTGGGPGGGPGGGGTPGITNLMDGRNSYLLSLSDFTQTQPTISNIIESNSSPFVTDFVTITASITDETTVYLGYRSEVGAPFIRVQMFDDGAHGDGAANDGVYGVDIPITDLVTEYYIYAENANIGKFSPVRAEHEYYTINATYSSSPLGDLVINEFMASNDLTIADQDGEFDDWIELYNNGTTTIDLSGYYLSDDDTDLTQWQFPTGTTIGSDDYLIIWADKDDLQVGLHANFKLSAAAESVVLTDTSGINIIDQVDYINQTADTSYARIPNGTGNFEIATPTFDANNSACAGVSLDINFDGSPSQTSWELTNVIGNVVASSNGTYGIDMANSNLPLSDISCLLDGCYTLTFYDSANDGMCPRRSTTVLTGINISTLGLGGVFSGAPRLAACGNYMLTDANGGVLVSGGGRFGTSEVSNFCISDGLAELVQPDNYWNTEKTNATSDLQVLPNLVENEMTVIYSSKEIADAELHIIDINGKTLQQHNIQSIVGTQEVRLNVNQLTAGFYFVKLVSGDIMMTKKFVKQ